MSKYKKTLLTGYMCGIAIGFGLGIIAFNREGRRG